MWSTRITESIRRAGGSAVRLGSVEELAVAIEAYDLGEEPTLGGAVIDLNARRFDAVEAIEQVHRARLPVIAVAQHDDQVTRKRALKAGASRVFSYDKFFREGTRLVDDWLVPGAPAIVDDGHRDRS